MTIHQDYIIFNTSLQGVKLLFFYNKLSKHENFVNKRTKFKLIRYS